jgi:hypothetical protein
MSAAVRSYLTAGVALVGAGIVTAAGVVPPLQNSEARVVERAVTLAAAVGGACSSYNIEGCDIWAPQSYTPVTYNPNAGLWRNVPANLVNAVISIPRALVDGLNELSYGFEVTGSWWVYTPTNVLGFDPADPPKVSALMNLLIPFKPLSQPLGEGLTWWARANLTMNEGCTGTAGPVCPDPNALLATMFQVPTTSMINGFRFPDVIPDPVSPLEGSMGNPLPADYPGNIDRQVPWAGAYVQLNPLDPEYSVLNYLKADPSTNRPERVTFAEVASSLTRFVKASKLDFYPFVPMSFLLKGWPYTALTPLFKPFLPWLCPDCNPLNPAWPPGATEQPWPSATVPAPVPAPAPAEASAVEGSPVSAATAPATAAPAEPAVAESAAATDRVSLTGRAKRAQARIAKPAAAVTSGDVASGDVAPVTTAGTAEAPVEAPTESGVTQRRASRASEAGNAKADRAGTDRSGHSTRGRAAAKSGE